MTGDIGWSNQLGSMQQGGCVRVCVCGGEELSPAGQPLAASSSWARIHHGQRSPIEYIWIRAPASTAFLSTVGGIGRVSNNACTTAPTQQPRHIQLPAGAARLRGMGSTLADEALPRGGGPRMGRF